MFDRSPSPRTKPRHLESAEQKAVVAWADMTPLPGGPPEWPRVGHFLLAVPNGGARRPVEAAIMRGEGVRKGVPDLTLQWPASGYAGLWVEMKSGEGETSEDQADWLLRLRAAGYRTEVAFGAASAIQIIREYLGIR